MARLKLLIFVLLAHLSMQQSSAQSIIKLRSTLGVGGSSKVITTQQHNLFVQQSIGQFSVIGSYRSTNTVLRQGFIQPPASSNSIPVSRNLQAKVFPNPFLGGITITFSEKIDERLNVVLYDLFGRTICSNQYDATQELSLDYSHLMQGLYIIKIYTRKKYLSANLIKE